jgi:Nuclease-related domain
VSVSSDGYTSEGERVVARVLESALRDSDRLWANQRVTDDLKNAEVDFFIAMPGAGFAVLEVKGGQITHNGEHWLQTAQNGKSKRIDPVTQAREGMYGLRRYVETDPRWGSRGRIRWAHAVVFPFTSIADDFALPDCPRHMVFGRDDLDGLVERIAAIALRQESSCRVPTYDDVLVLDDIMRGRGLPQADVISLAAERDAMSDRLTEQQGMLLEVSTLMRRIEIRGGAGSGKTWLAMEQARRLRKDGRRVALVCYSRGLAAYFERVTSVWGRRERPSYVGTFHGLGIEEWGAEPSPAGDDDSDYWEQRLPEMMVSIAAGLDVGKRFDAIVVDEAQDFADQWWPAVVAALKEPETGSLSIFSDEGQRVFARFGGVPECQAVFVLEQNLRNTRQIAETFQPLGLTRMRLRGGEGPRVRFVPCTADEAIGAADEAVDAVLDAGWRPQDVALLTTGSRHPEQAARQAEGQDEYWASFWDDDQVFYGHVLGFKGLERRVIVLAVNESEPRDRAKERLYVGLSRARDELVVCGDLDYIARVGGPELAQRLERGSV